MYVLFRRSIRSGTNGKTEIRVTRTRSREVPLIRSQTRPRLQMELHLSSAYVATLVTVVCTYSDGTDA